MWFTFHHAFKPLLCCNLLNIWLLVKDQQCVSNNFNIRSNGVQCCCLSSAFANCSQKSCNQSWLILPKFGMTLLSIAFVDDSACCSKYKAACLYCVLWLSEHVKFIPWKPEHFLIPSLVRQAIYIICLGICFTSSSSAASSLAESSTPWHNLRHVHSPD